MKKHKEVIYTEDLLKAIQNMPNCPNGHSSAYDKATIFNMVEKIPKYHCETIKNKNRK